MRVLQKRLLMVYKASRKKLCMAGLGSAAFVFGFTGSDELPMMRVPRH